MEAGTLLALISASNMPPAQQAKAQYAMKYVANFR
jgi:hypothetical protein